MRMSKITSGLLFYFQVERVKKMEASLNLKEDAKRLQLLADSSSSYFLSSVSAEVAHFAR